MPYLLHNRGPLKGSQQPATPSVHHLYYLLRASVTLLKHSCHPSLPTVAPVRRNMEPTHSKIPGEVSRSRSPGRGGGDCQACVLFPGYLRSWPVVMRQSFLATLERCSAVYTTCSLFGQPIHLTLQCLLVVFGSLR